LVCVLFGNFIALTTQLSLHKHVVKHYEKKLLNINFTNQL
jgi:hypothetical protein